MASSPATPTRKVHFEALSMMGRKVGSFDYRDRADDFRKDRAERNVRIRLVKVTTITEELD